MADNIPDLLGALQRSVDRAREDRRAAGAPPVTTPDTTRPVILNPEAVGDPDSTPLVQLPPAMAAHFERTRCPECRQINHTHADDCTQKARDA